VIRSLLWHKIKIIKVKACLHCGSTVRYLPSAVLIDYCNCCRGSHRSAITLRTPFAITPASRHTFSTQPRLGLPWRLPPTYPSPGPRHFSIFKCDNIDQPFIQISSILPFPFLFYLGPQACVLKVCGLSINSYSSVLDWLLIFSKHRGK
jgi:hypothetical protein